MIWENGTHTSTADEVLSIKAEGGGEVFNEAKQLLLSLLKGDASPSRKVKELAANAGISERTLKRAKAALKVSSEYDKSASDFIWKLPDQGANH